jgi:hypothetical protein
MNALENILKLYEVWDFHSSENVDCELLVYNAMCVVL